MQVEFLNAFAQAGIERGDTVFVHSDAGPALDSGNIFRVGAALGVLKEAFLEAIGPEGTFIVPTFNYDFCKGKPYTHVGTPSQVGLLSSRVLEDKRAIRSFHPIYSVAAIGAKADAFTRGVSKSSFAEGSIFHRLHEQDAKLVFFNVSFYYCTFIHYVEQRIGVDYRFLKNFTGTVRYNGKEYTDTFDFYARYLDRDIVLDLTRLEKALLADGRMSKALLAGRYPILQVRCNELYEEAVRRVKEDPYYLLKHPPVSIKHS